jgi:ABC-type branched-subunit amino acid transport system ATPase component
MSSVGEAEVPIKLVATFLGFNGVGKTTLLYNILDRPIPASGVPWTVRDEKGHL